MDPNELWALCLWREARGEGVEGMRAVAWIIWNRSRHWGKTLPEVIMGRNQFTSMSVEKNPPNPEQDDLQMAEARQIVKDIVTHADTIDPTKGALYYANLASVRAANLKAKMPADAGWFFQAIVHGPDHPQLAVIGEHTFFA